MGREQEFEAGTALAIALAILPLTAPIYGMLGLLLMAMCVRLIWISFRQNWVRWSASGAVVILLATVLLPQFLTRLAA